MIIVSHFFKYTGHKINIPAVGLDVGVRSQAETHVLPDRGIGVEVHGSRAGLAAREKTSEGFLLRAVFSAILRRDIPAQSIQSGGTVHNIQSMWNTEVQNTECKGRWNVKKDGR